MAESIETKSAAPPVFPTLHRVLQWRRDRRWRNIIAASGLPALIAELLARVVKRTRLWRGEKRAVARELIAHFHDGLAVGESAEMLLARFGDERAAARLIRRSKKRNRSWLWHAWKYLLRVFLLLLAGYIVVFIRFSLSRPTIRIDYLARLNSPALSTPLPERAWPIYRQALLKLGEARDVGGISAEQLAIPSADGSERWLIDDASPADAEWPKLVAWLGEHAAEISMLRQAAAKPQMGFVLGPGGDANDAALGFPAPVAGEQAMNGSLLELLLPHLQRLRLVARILMADARVALVQRDSARAVADYHAGLQMAAQDQMPIVVNRFVGIGIGALAMEQIEIAMRDASDTFTDAQLVELAHAVATISGDTPSNLIDLSGERMYFHDMIQRTYSDNGHGDGILTRAGARAWSAFAPRWPQDTMERTMTFAAFGAASVTNSRRVVTEEYDRLLNQQALRLSQPLRDVADHETEESDSARGFSSNPMQSTRYLPITLLMPSLSRAAQLAERYLGARDGMEVGLALELYRRRSGRYPQSLNELTPHLLPRVPADRIDGQPLRFRIIDGRPVIYSVGVDRKDDHGRLPRDKAGKLMNRFAAAEWPISSSANPPVDGDWIVFGLQSFEPATQPSKQ